MSTEGIVLIVAIIIILILLFVPFRRRGGKNSGSSFMDSIGDIFDGGGDSGCGGCGS